MPYKCTTCGQIHDDLPSFGADRPDQYWDVPIDKRETDVFLTSDSCVIAGRFFFIRGCLDIPILGTDEVFSWGVWVSLKEENFFIWQRNYDSMKRSHLGPFFGWFSTRIPGYGETINLKSMAHLRDNGIRPYIELEKTDHPLAVEQREGMQMARVHELLDLLQTDNPASSTDSF